jgi:hypothetical protein
MKNRFNLCRNGIDWRGKSGLRRAGWFLTGTAHHQMVSKESAAENRLPGGG